jgi:hypothetical protein
MPLVIAIGRVGQHASFTFVSNKFVFADSLIIIALSSHSDLCFLQSRIHEVWIRLFASSMKDDLRYTSTDCFETFPFPENFEANAALEQAGSEYYEFRAHLMVANNEGLTKTYNRFHDPNERSAGIKKLRELHDAIDRAVLDAYGWTDLRPTCKFLLDYEDENDEDNGTRSSSRSRRKPWRYRWPDDFRDEVLARLLELNTQRAEQERLAGLSAEVTSTNSRKRTSPGTKSGRTKKRRSNQTTEDALPNLPGMTT